MSKLDGDGRALTIKTPSFISFYAAPIKSGMLWHDYNDYINIYYGKEMLIVTFVYFLKISFLNPKQIIFQQL